MTTYIPTNKQTGKEYHPISEEEMKAYEAPNSAVRGKYRFRAIEDKTPRAPAPIEAKQVASKD
jgi:hypothetical protein